MININKFPSGGTFDLPGEYEYEGEKLKFTVVMCWNYTEHPSICKIKWIDRVPLDDIIKEAEQEIREAIHSETRLFNITYQ